MVYPSSGCCTEVGSPTFPNGWVYGDEGCCVNTMGPCTAVAAVADPVISPESQEFSGTLEITITDATAGATIYYTTDGTTPTALSPVYTVPFTIGVTTTVKAFAVLAGLADSMVVTEVYTIVIPLAEPPVFQPTTSAFNPTVSVTITSATAGASIYYTTDGSVPTTASTLYVGAILVTSTTNFRAIATKFAFADSTVTNKTYTLTPPVADWSGYFGSSADPLLAETSWDADFQGGGLAGGDAFLFTVTDWTTLDHFITFGDTVGLGGAAPGPYRYYIRQYIADPPNTPGAQGFFTSLPLNAGDLAGVLDGYTDFDSNGWPCLVVTRTDASVWVMYRLLNPINGAFSLRVRSTTGP